MNRIAILAIPAFVLQVPANPFGDEPRPSTCGIDALASCYKELSIDVSFVELGDSLPRRGQNLSLDELASYATDCGLVVRGVRWEVGDIPAGTPPAIIPVTLRDGRRHYLAVRRWNGWQALIQDGESIRWVSLQRLQRANWDGTALHIARDQAALDAVFPPWWKSSRLHYGMAAGLFMSAAFIVRRKRNSTRVRPDAADRPASLPKPAAS